MDKDVLTQLAMEHSAIQAPMLTYKIIQTKEYKNTRELK